LWRSVAAVRDSAARREEFDLGTFCDESLGRIQHAGHVSGISRGDGDTDSGPTVELMLADLSDAHLEAAQVGDQRTHDRSLLLERVHVTEKDVELQPADPHPNEATGS
jgi:hypothetical protein